MAVAWHTAHNQPPHPGFFIGEGMPTPPTPNITVPGGNPNPGKSIYQTESGAKTLRIRYALGARTGQMVVNGAGGAFFLGRLTET